MAKTKNYPGITMEDHITMIREKMHNMTETEIKNWIQQFTSNNSQSGDYDKIIQELRNQIARR